MNVRRWRWWAFWLVHVVAVGALAIAICSCRSSGSSSKGSVTERATEAATSGWFLSMIARIGERLGEIAISVGVGLVTAVAVGADVVSGGVISLATICASFAFRPAQVVHNVNTGGGSYTDNSGGGDAMGFLSWVGLVMLIWLGVKYLVIPRSARNFWSGLWGVITKRGARVASLRRMVSASGATHTSKATAETAKLERDFHTLHGG